MDLKFSYLLYEADDNIMRNFPLFDPNVASINRRIVFIYMTAKKVGQKGRSNPIERKVPDLERHCYLQNWEQTHEFFMLKTKSVK